MAFGSIWVLKHKLEAKNRSIKLKGKIKRKRKKKMHRLNQTTVPRHHISPERGCIMHPSINGHNSSKLKGEQQRIHH
jgi:hypothetical protein